MCHAHVPSTSFIKKLKDFKSKVELSFYHFFLKLNSQLYVLH